MLLYRVFSHDVMEVMLLSLNKAKVAMLVTQTNPPEIELYSYANVFFNIPWLKKIIWVITVLLRTPITQMIFFNQGMLLLGSNHFLVFFYYSKHAHSIGSWYHYHRFANICDLTMGVLVYGRFDTNWSRFETSLKSIRYTESIRLNSTFMFSTV